MNTELTTRSPRSDAAALTRASRKPAFDVFASDDAFNARLYLPGVRKDDVSLTVEDDVLTVEASPSAKLPEKARLLRRELPQGDYRLRLVLGREVDRDKISAEVKDGVLYLTLPKAEAVKPRSITVA